MGRVHAHEEDVAGQRSREELAVYTEDRATL